MEAHNSRLWQRPKSVRTVARLPPFDFSRAVADLCDDVSRRLPELNHVRMDKIAVCFAQTRTHAMHGLQAKLTPLRFRQGAMTTTRRGRTYTVQRLIHDKREMLYILTFYLPRFLNHTFREKFVTILHELFHISPRFDGDIRRFDGRYHVHSHSQKEYDQEMDRLAQHYLAMQPPPSLYTFLHHDFTTLQQLHGGVVGLQIPIPKLLPVKAVG